MQIYTATGSSKVQWQSFQSSTKPLTWYQVNLLSLNFVVPLIFLNNAWVILEGIQSNILKTLAVRSSYYFMLDSISTLSKDWEV